MKKVTSIIIILGILIGGYFLLNKKQTPINNQPIKIGVVLPMTGIAASYGENQLNAINLAVKEINQNGGVLGRNIQVVSEDDGTDPGKTVSAFQKVTQIDHVPVVIGGMWDFLANAIMPIIKSSSIPVVSPSAAPDTLDKAANTFFTTFPPVSIHQPIVEKYLNNEKGKTVAIMYINNPWGMAHRDMYRKAVIATGKTLVTEVELPKFDNNDIQREITLLKSSKPDILLTAIAPADSKLIVEKNPTLGLNARIFGHENFIGSYLNQGINKTDLKGVVAYTLALPTSGFVKKYTDTYGKNPINEADKAYDAIYIIVKAIEISKDPSSAGILVGLRQVKDYVGASGSFDYTKSNWPTAESSRLEIFDGNNFVPYLAN